MKIYGLFTSYFDDEHLRQGFLEGSFCKNKYY
jgi:hypothetical protein